jgi:D-glycerate 3-kinase
MQTREERAAEALGEAGPAFGQLRRLGPIDWSAWVRVARALEQALGGDDRRIHHLYLPVLFFCAAQVRLAPRRPVFIGLQAPQGAGKTTLVTHLLESLPELNLRGAGISIDDFYLTRGEQQRLTDANPDNPFYAHRGYPGTHDVDLGVATLDALGRLGPNTHGESVRVPVYDKSAHQGRGDRAPESAWRIVSGPLDLVIVEGWMLGFTPVAESALTDPMLALPNRALAAYDAWHARLDAFVSLRAIDPMSVINWRIDAEEEMKTRGKPGMTREQASDFIHRFLPAYQTYADEPTFPPSERRLEIWIDDRRRPVLP